MFKFNDEKGQLKCSFCGKPQEIVKKINEKFFFDEFSEIGKDEDWFVALNYLKSDLNDYIDFFEIFFN
mgnify:CR=1 FL=1